MSACDGPAENEAECDWGWLSLLSLVSGIGLLLLALAYTAARDDRSWAELLFWIALLILFVPTAARLVSTAPGRYERIGLVVLLGLALYLVKVLHSPIGFTFHDEFGHWRSTEDILRTHHLYAENPVVRGYPYYPGVLIATSALVDLGGMSIFAAGVILIGVARLVLVLSIFLLYERVSGSARLSSLATLLYMTNPSFLYFDAQFAYESLALAFAACALAGVALRQRGHPPTAPAWRLVIGLTLAATVVSHHLTSYALVAFLVVWTLIRLPLRRARQLPQPLPGPGGAALMTVVMIALWLLIVATVTLEYLGPVLSQAVLGLFRLGLQEESSSRELFRASTGQVDPLWERVVGLGSVAVIMVGIPFGIWRVRQRWLQGRVDALTLAFVGVSLTYPVTMALRLTTAGAETSDRASAFVYLGIGVLLAVAVGSEWEPVHGGEPPQSGTASPPKWRRWKIATFAIGATLLFVGGITVAWSREARMPGSYLVVADPRSIEPEGVDAAFWARQNLSPGNPIVADRINGLLMASYGRQDPQSSSRTAFLLLFSTTVDDEVVDIIREYEIRYLVIDYRLSDGLPLRGFYLSQSELNAYRHSKPVDPAALAKFDGVPGVSRIFDSGDIAVYDVSALAGILGQ